MIQFPPRGKEYITPDTLIITITIRKKSQNRYYTFGGPHWTGELFFSDDEMYLSYLSPLKKPRTIKYEEIVEITFRHFGEG
jgi:hypothetical protein